MYQIQATVAMEQSEVRLDIVRGCSSRTFYIDYRSIERSAQDLHTRNFL